jgi:hypothetical protein
MSVTNIKETITDLLETGLGEQAGKCHFCGRVGDKLCLWCDSSHKAGWAAKTINAALGIARRNFSSRSSNDEVMKHWEEYYHPDWSGWTADEKHIWLENYKKKLDEKLKDLNCSTRNDERII